MLSAGPHRQRDRPLGREGAGRDGRAQTSGPWALASVADPDHAGNVVGIDRHTRTLTAVVVDARGAILAGEHFRVSGEGHRALLAWARSFGVIARWGVETASGGAGTRRSSWPAASRTCVTCAPTAPPAPSGRDRAARPTRSTPNGSRANCSRTRCCPRACKRAGGQLAEPDPADEQLMLGQRQRRSIRATR